jgi:hypothetical protein
MIKLLAVLLSSNGGDRVRGIATSIFGGLVATAVTAFALFVLTLSPAQAGDHSLGGADCAVPGGAMSEECCVCSDNPPTICLKSDFMGNYDRCGPGWCPDETNCQIEVH